MPDQFQLNLTLLRFLKRQKHPMPLSEIEARLDLGHGELIADLDWLAGDGYEIEVHPYLGVRLIDIPDRLLDHEIQEDLNTKVIGRRLHIFGTCTSTNDQAWNAIQSGSGGDGELFIADHQSSGRGRMGRAWDSPRGSGLYFSFISRQKIGPDKLPYITSATALAIANTIEQFVHLPAEIKWPNDVLIGNRKVAGVLVESRSNHPDTFVVGIGVNVNQRAEDFPSHLRAIATSLRLERKAGPINRIRLLRPLLFYLDNVFAQVKKRKYERISKAWSEFVTIAGREVVLRAKGEDHTGILLSIDPGEGLSLRCADGTEKHFRAEHVASLQLVDASPADDASE